MWSRINIVLDRCKSHNITISRKKLEIGEEIEFAGHVISSKGIRPDPSKFQAIRDFPAPKNIKELRSYMGLANQLSSFIPDLQQCTSNMHKLLSPKNEYIWTPTQEEEFKRSKDVLLSTKVVQPFNPAWATVVLTDASRLNGIGFALVQYDPRRTDGKKQFALVQCGSSSLTSAQGNYATIELECLAIQYALSKSEFYLRGLPTFAVWTDHRPLVGIFNKALHTLNNQCLIRIREKLLDFSFTVTWVPGKTHYIADALSRYPVLRTPRDGTPHRRCCDLLPRKWLHVPGAHPLLS